MTGLTHLRFVVDDFAPMLAFYRDALGFRVVVDVPGVYVELDTGAARIGLVARAVMADALEAAGDAVAAKAMSPARAGAAGDVVLQVAVANVDAASDWLSGRGVVLATPPRDQPSWMLRVAHVRDPQGHVIELTTPLAST